VDKLTKEQRKRNMQAVKSEGSKIEVILAKQLWNKGYRYRKNDKKVFGKPDLTFKRFKLVVFVDGDFWHGKDWKKRKHDHKSNQAFWHNKIEKNIERDKKVNLFLEQQDWKVLRFWGSEIEKEIDKCIFKIESTINEIKRKNKN
jgi:DNA mismatch endonuclease Vsr